MKLLNYDYETTEWGGTNICLEFLRFQKKCALMVFICEDDNPIYMGGGLNIWTRFGGDSIFFIQISLGNWTIGFELPSDNYIGVDYLGSEMDKFTNITNDIYN